jgi:hypothetical protein
VAENASGRYMNYSPNNRINSGWHFRCTPLPTSYSRFMNDPIPGKSELLLCEIHVKHLELKEVVIYDEEVTELAPSDYCWV